MAERVHLGDFSQVDFQSRFHLHTAFDEKERGMLCRYYPSSGKWTNDICAFDDGVCLNGLVNSHKITRDERCLQRASAAKDGIKR